MTLSSSILNSDDPEWIQGRLLAELQRLNARIDELEDKASVTSENLLDLDNKPQARRNIGIPDGSSTAPYLVWETSGWNAGTITAGAESLNDLTDVTLTSPTSGQVLSYNGTAWINLNQSALSISYNDLTDVPSTFPPSAHTHTLSGDVTGTVTGPVTIANGAVTAAKANADDFILNVSGGWVVDASEFMFLAGGSDILFASGTPSSPTGAASNSGIGWAYSATRAVRWENTSTQLILSDGPLGSAPDGTNPIEYTPSATDANRLLNIDVALDLQGVSPTTGQVIIADANGKPEWGDADSAAIPPMGGGWTRVTASTTLTYQAGATALLLALVGGGGGGGGKYTINLDSPGGGGGGGAAIIASHQCNGGNAVVTLGSGGAAGADNANGSKGGTTTVVIDGVTYSAEGGSGGVVGSNDSGGFYTFPTGGAGGGGGRNIGFISSTRLNFIFGYGGQDGTAGTVNSTNTPSLNVTYGGGFVTNVSINQVHEVHSSRGEGGYPALSLNNISTYGRGGSGWGNPFTAQSGAQGVLFYRWV